MLSNFENLKEEYVKTLNGLDILYKADLFIPG